MSCHHFRPVEIAAIHNNWVPQTRTQSGQIQRTELLPIGQYEQRVGSACRLIGVFSKSQVGTREFPTLFTAVHGSRIVRRTSATLIQPHAKDSTRLGLTYTS